MRGNYMFLGFENEFVIRNIFGEKDVLTGAVIDNINYQPLDFRMTMDILTKSRVINPPSKWDEWDYVALNIEFFAIKEFNIKINHEVLVVNTSAVRKEKNSYVMEISGENQLSLLFGFSVARVQRVIPMKYSIELKAHEKALLGKIN